jgi:hypothetical protein
LTGMTFLSRRQTLANGGGTVKLAGEHTLPRAAGANVLARVFSALGLPKAGSPLSSRSPFAPKRSFQKLDLLHCVTTTFADGDEVAAPPKKKHSFEAIFAPGERPRCQIVKDRSTFHVAWTKSPGAKAP